MVLKGLFKFITQGRLDIQKATAVAQLDTTSGVRSLRLPYHPYVLREALVNAVLHCNYNVGEQGHPVVEVYLARGGERSLQITVQF